MPVLPRPHLSRSDARFWLAALLVLAVCLAVAPLTYLRMDFETYWLPWARSTEGVRPWAMYQRTFPTEVGERPCNYAPFIPYVLTFAEAARRAVGAPEMGTFALLSVKLPFLLAHIAGAAVCRFGLRRPFGERGANTAGWLYLLCLPLLYNAAIWGQADTVLALALTGAVVALLHDRALLCGTLVGLGLVIKPQMAAAVPALFVYVRRRLGPDATLHAMLAGLAAIAAVALPYVLAGAGQPMWEGTTAGMDYYPFRQVNMYNPWYLLDWAQQARSPRGTFGLIWDFEPVLGPLAWKQIGLALFGGYVLFVCAALWRRRPAPEPSLLLFGLLLLLFAFTMLPTQMHGRYLLPGVALAALAWPVVPAARPLFAVWCVTLTVDQWLVMQWGHRTITFDSVTPLTAPPVLIGLVLAVIHTAQFVWATIVFLRSLRSAPPLPAA